MITFERNQQKLTIHNHCYDVSDFAQKPVKRAIY